MYMERFLFNVYPEELDNKLVQFQVFSCDKYARHKLLGETEIKLGDIDIRQPIRVWMNLRDMDQVHIFYNTNKVNQVYGSADSFSPFSKKLKLCHAPYYMPAYL